MEPVEINAGAWYLRALRDDSRVDDRPALAELGMTDLHYVARRKQQWIDDTAYSWAVCEPTTGELVAEIVLEPHAGTLRIHARDGRADAATAGERSIRRFADSALGISLTAVTGTAKPRDSKHS